MKKPEPAKNFHFFQKVQKNPLSGKVSLQYEVNN